MSSQKDSLEKYFKTYRKETIGHKQKIETPYHKEIKIIYADWIASGRMYAPIEKRMKKSLYPFMANTHTDTNYTGSTMTYAYHKAQQIIKKHVNACKDDVLISSNSGMTGVVNKFQRILGMKIHESFKSQIEIPEEERPIVFISHMEHHSNQTSWLETTADVEIIPPNKEGLVCIENFKETLKKYKNRKTKIVAITSCSNVTGVSTPYMDLAELIHAEGGYCFADFACSAPYIDIDMHPDDAKGRYLDAIFFSPHKFLGGPGSTGVLIFNKKLYKNTVPDVPGGGTVDWTNPWGDHKYIDDIEVREDGGTPAFTQTIKTALCLQLKNQMGVDKIKAREEELLSIVWERMDKLENVHVLADQHRDRVGAVSFYIEDLHYNLAVKILNDRFGIQTRGGCSCAGTYGHYLLNVTRDVSDQITCRISEGDNTDKPGWIRMSIHPTMKDKEVVYIMDAIEMLARNHQEWIQDYDMNPKTGAIQHKKDPEQTKMKQWVDSAFESEL